MRRVLLVVWGFEAYGGMERHVCELALALHQAGIDVAVVSEMPVGRSNFYARRLRTGGVVLHAPELVLRFVNGLAIALQPSAAQQLIHGGGLLSRRLRRVLERLTVPGRGDVIHIHGCQLGQSWLIEWARPRCVATVYTEHVAVAESGGPLTQESVGLAFSAGALACVSAQSRDSLATLLPKHRQIAVTGHIMADMPLSASACSVGEPFELVCVARLEPRKGIDTLLTALADLRQRAIAVRLTILGDGPLSSAMKGLAIQLGIQSSVRFAGPVSPGDVSATIMRADAIVIPSRSEGLPLVLLEAMACGKAIIATRAGGIPEIVQDRENGLLVPTDDPAALAHALAEIARDDDLRERLGKNARRSWQGGGHCAAQVVPKILQLYRDAEAAC